jgi:purine-binding chemotaxis protein CheW
LELDSGQIEPPPKIGTHLHSDFLIGIGKNDGKFIMILDVDKIFSADELSNIQETAA